MQVKYFFVTFNINCGFARSFCRKTVWTDAKFFDGSVRFGFLKTESEPNFGFPHIPNYNLPKSQTNRLQVIQNSLAQAVVKALKFCHVAPILKSVHWLKINECIEYKCLYLFSSSSSRNEYY